MAGSQLAPDVPHDMGKIIRGRSIAPAMPSYASLINSGAIVGGNGVAAPVQAAAAPFVRPTSYAGQFATGTLPGQAGPSYAEGGSYDLSAGGGGTPFSQAKQAFNDTQAGKNIAKTTAPAPAGPEAPNVFNQTPATLPDNALGGRPLTNGVRRYNIGGDVGGANAAQVYATTGKDGVPIFTDNASYAERNSNGRGLSKTIDQGPGVPGANPTSMYANSQGPNAGREYAASQLAAGGATPQAIANFSPQDTATAYSRAQAFAAGDPRVKGVPQSDQGVSDDIALNQLRARMSGNGGSINGVGGAPGIGQGAGGPGIGLTPQMQIAMYSAKTRADQGAERNATAQAMLKVAQANSAREAGSESRQATSATLGQYQKLLSNPDTAGSAAQFLASKLQAGVKNDPKYLDSDEGQQVSNMYLHDVLQKGAQKGYLSVPSLTPNYAGERVIPSLGYGNVQIGSNGFAGMRRPSDQGGNDNASYPVADSFGQRLINAKPLFSDFNNYDPSVNTITPEVWKALQAHGNKGG